MNVLFLTAWYPVKNTPHKGIFIREHARAIAAQGHNVCVVALDVSESSSFYSRSAYSYVDLDNIPTHVISLHSVFYKKLYAIYPLLKYTLRNYVLDKIVPGFKPDLVHSNVLYPTAMIGDDLARHLRIPHVITEHWSKAKTFLDRNFFANAGKMAYRNAAAVTCVSIFLKKQVSEYLAHTRRVTVIPNVVRTEFFEYAPKPETNPLVFVAVATWLPPKRPDLFVLALNQIAKKTGRNIQLHVFGEGRQLDDLIKTAFTKELQIISRGYCTKEEIGRQLRNAHFMVHASEIETFSIVVAEALCSGTPVIVSDRGALPELVDGTNGVLSDNTLSDWENNIAEAIATKYDYPAISDKYRIRFSPESVGNAFSRLYKEINTHRTSN